MISGNTDGIKEHILNELDTLYEQKIQKGNLISQEIVEYISVLSNKINREINISLDRAGNIIEISIGDSSTVNLPIINVYDKKLSGIRVIHTHPGGNPHLSMVDISALMKLKLDCIVSIGVNDNGITGYEIAFCSFENNILSYEKKFLRKIEDFEYLEKVREIETELKKSNIVEDDKEYAILIGIDEEKYLDELEELAYACDVEVVGKFFQKRKKADPVFLIGSGKVSELSLERQIKKANLLIFDEELSGLQLRKIEDATGCKVIDRTTLILEIFARRARTREAKLQVELAQLKYRSNRLIGFGITMSKLGGGVGTKGPGEKKLEIDRRIIKKNIQTLKHELDEIKKTRALQRVKREESGIGKVSLVGYTNVGKSTLRNLLVDLYPSDKTLKKEEVLSKNMLFATLETTTRTIVLTDKRIISLTDTVGFIQKLPHDLVESFKSTLEEVIFSDLILHVVDVAAEDAIEQINSVEEVLKELDCLNKVKILVLNKFDKIPAYTDADGLITPQPKENYIEQRVKKIKELYSNYKIICVSAKSQYNIEKLVNLISEELPDNSYNCTLLIPYSNTEIQAKLHRNSIINREEYLENGIELDCVLKEKEYNMFRKYIVKEK